MRCERVKAHRISPAALRAEGILEAGAIAGTAALFVRTEHGLHLFHFDSVPVPPLGDRQCERLATRMAEGATMADLARELGVHLETLARELRARGVACNSRRAIGQRARRARERELAAC